MKESKRLFIGLAGFLTLLILIWTPPILSVNAAAATIILINRSNQKTTEIHDGDQVSLVIENVISSSNERNAAFQLDSGLVVASCSLPSGKTTCRTTPISTLGWYWQSGGKPMPFRQISIIVDQSSDSISPLTIKVSPRPVVMVHGFLSSYEGWQNYLGPEGFLAKVGLQGYAVGDGQVEGIMNTGSLTNPRQRTNTVIQNSQELAKYIQGVKRKTGAEMVDLIGHSMGGIISRMYIDQQMQQRDVAQLIMLGSPMGGSECANLPASLGFYLPASLEIRPSYMLNIFNLQITHRKGIRFNDLAGTPILDGFKSPCTAVPSDLVVSLNSVNAIPLHSGQSSTLHIELNTSKDVFDNFVLPLLQTPAGELIDEPDAASAANAAPGLQFTRMFTGTIPAGGNQELTINIDPGVTVASFALFDSSRSLNVRVRGASGNEITLDPQKNGLVIVNDPSMLFYLGYGFNNPKPGAWVVRLEASDKTPPTGAEYALSAHFAGGPTLQANALPILPAFGAEVSISAHIEDQGINLPLQAASAFIQKPDGSTENIMLEIQLDQASVSWKPTQEGLYGINVYTQAVGSNSRPVERTAFLTLQVQPQNPLTDLFLIILGLCLVCVFGFLFVGFVWFAIRRRRKSVTKPI